MLHPLGADCTDAAIFFNGGVDTETAEVLVWAHFGEEWRRSNPAILLASWPTLLSSNLSYTNKYLRK